MNIVKGKLKVTVQDIDEKLIYSDLLTKDTEIAINVTKNNFNYYIINITALESSTYILQTIKNGVQILEGVPYSYNF